MHFKVKNQWDGRTYPAIGQYWPEYGWHVQVLDLEPETWGRSLTGVGAGPVIDQGWQKELERKGYEFPVLQKPENIKQKVLAQFGARFGNKAAKPSNEADALLPEPPK